MKLSELIKPLQEIEKEYGGNIEIDVGMSDCMTTLAISKVKRVGDITVLEMIKLINCD